MKTYADIASRARALHDAGAVPTRQWTLPLVCDHLAKAMVGSTGARGPAADAAPFSFPRRFIGRVLVLRLGYIPHGVKSPARIVPRADISWEQAIADLDEAVSQCERKSHGADPWLPHPMMGFADARNWLRFHLVHARHHFACLKIPPSVAGSPRAVPSSAD